MALLEKILNKYGWYRPHKLVIGGHCGLCGAWISDQVFPKWWRWGVCDKCAKESEDE